MTTPAIAALKRALPQASLTYVVEESYRPLVEGNPDIDKVVLIPPHQGIFSFLNFIRRVRREKYDIVIDFHGGPRASRIAWLSRAGLKVGYELKHKRFMYDVRVPRHREGAPVHGVENHLNLVKALGIEVLPVPPLVLPAARIEEREKIDKFWLQNNLQEKTVVILHIGAGNEYRDWGEENLASLALKLAGRPGTRVVLAGASQDEARAERLIRMSNIPLLSLVGKINLIELRELIGRASLFAGPDSGPMHVAAATSTPIVALFGPTIPVHFGPWKAEATLVERDLDCRPCRQKQCITKDFRCLRGITPSDVFSACLRYL